MYLLNAFMLVALAWISDQISIVPGCKDHGGLYVAHYQKALIGHTFLSRSGTSRVQCMMLCSRHSRCLSFNHEDTSSTCQLNNERKEEFLEKLHQDVGFSYFGGLKPRTQGIEDITEQLSTDAADVANIASSTECDCCSPLGMESGAILDHQKTAKNVLADDDEIHGSKFARFNSESAWCGAGGSSTWIQVTFNQSVSFYGLIVQPHASSGASVHSFRVSFDAEASWINRWQEHDFVSEQSLGHDFTVKLPYVVRSTFIRMHHILSHNGKCMRFEILGCI